MKTIAEQLNVKEFPFVIKDKNGNEIYFEDANGFWKKKEYDKNGNEIYFEDANGFGIKKEYDKNGNEIYFENSHGFWAKREFDGKRNITYYEDASGKIIDNGLIQHKEIVLTMQEIAKKFNISVEQLKIKK